MNNLGTLIYPAKLNGEDVWFCDERITLPENSGIYKYEVRHDNGTPSEVSNIIFADFYGTILSTNLIDLPIVVSLLKYEIESLDLEEGDFYVKSYKKDDAITILDLMIQQKVNKNDKSS